MERCAYCGHPVGEGAVVLGDEVFCSEDCMERFETGEGEIEYLDNNHFEDDGSVYDY